jgi:hypothetical protein
MILAIFIEPAARARPAAPIHWLFPNRLIRNLRISNLLILHQQELGYRA